ncbi:thyroid peroxidase-like [Fundulus diaphanus]
MLACSHPLIPHLDLSPWEEPHADPICGPIPRIHSGYSLLCDSMILYQCQAGFKLLGSPSISCEAESQKWSSPPPTCHDINECEELISSCPQHLECFNTAGSFLCSEPSSLSAVSIGAAVTVVIAGAAGLLLVLFCYRRYFPKSEELISAECTQGNS